MSANKKSNDIQYSNIIKKEDGIYVKEEARENESTERKVARSIGIDSIKINIDDGTKTSTIYFDDMVSTRNVEIPRDEYLNNKTLLSYQKYGMDVMPDTASIIAKHLRNEENIASKVFTHTTLGFSEYEGNTIYKLNKSIGIDSLYSGTLEIKPKGNREAWVNMFKNEVVGNTYLEFISIVALSSVLVGYVGEELALDSIIIHIFGNSSTGKSTALKLSISMFGYPDVKKNGLFSTFNSTENALIKKLSGIRGVPFAFDELSMSNLVNMTALVYKLANGKDKSRLTKTLEEEKADTWNTVILTNGEKSLIKSSDKNAGVQVRVIELGNVTWTKDAESADVINRTILENYGHIGFEFAQFIIKIGKEKIIEIYNKRVLFLNNFFKNKAMDDEFTSRRVNKFAIIMVTLSLFKKMVNLDIDDNSILKILLEIERESMKGRNFNRSAIDYIRQYISSNGSKFVYFDKEIGTKDYLGKLTKKSDHIELTITPLALDKILKEGGFQDMDVVIKELKKNGHLNHEKDRNTRKRELEKGILTKVYVIKLPK